MLTFRETKDAPLTFQEVDANFKNLDTRLKALEDSPPDAEGIADIAVTGDQMTLKGTRGTDFGPFTLPKVFWKARGTWQEQTAYAMADVVAQGQSLFLCTTAHISDQAFQPDDTWEEIFSFPKLEPASPLVEKVGGVAAPSCGKGNLPKNPDLGQMAFVVDAPQRAEIFYFEGKNWLSLSNHTPLKV